MNMVLIIGLLLLIVTCQISITHAGTVTTPQQLIYEGELLDNNGNPLTGKYDFRFSLWNNQDFETTDTIKGTINIGAADFNGWQEVHSIELTGGEFSLKLGSHTPFITGLFDKTNMYLQIEVKNTSDSDFNFELIDLDSVNNVLGRTLINTIPFAFNADKLDFHDLGYAPGEIPFIDLNTGKLPESIIPSELLKLTDGVNGNNFTIDLDGDASKDDLITLKFGDSLSKTLTWNGMDNQFEFNDRVYVNGDFMVTGTIRSTNLIINADDSSSDYIDLGFGEDLDVRMRYDILNSKFILNRNLEITEIIDSDGNSGQEGQVLTANGVGKNLWQNVSNNAIPYITSSTESFVPTSSTMSLTINGINFLPTTILTIPDFDGTIDSIQIISPTELQVDITAGETEATYDIEVSNDGVLNTQWSGNGENLILVSNPDGSRSNTPGESCEIILNHGYSTGDGNYWIDQDGESASNSFQVYCDMSAYSDDTVIPNSTKMDIVDVNFQDCIADRLDKDWTSITDTDLIGLSSHLQCDRRSITTLAGISAMPNLHQLYIYMNQLTTLPAEIGNLTQLLELNTGVNPLTTVPPEIGKLTNLKSLYIYKTQIATIPAEISHLTNLDTFQLQENQLTNIPVEIENLTNLRAFHLGRNPNLISLPQINGGGPKGYIDLRGSAVTCTEAANAGWIATCYD